MSGEIRVRNLSKRFDNILAVNDLNLDISKGEIVALLGPNGAGKSTFMKMISGFLHPTTGSIHVCDFNVADNEIEVKKRIGFLPEGAPLYSDMTVLMFINYMSELRGFFGKEKEEKVKSAIQKAKIKEVEKQRIETLSKGYLRRVGFAQAILHDPEILLLDEPTDGLDPNQKFYIRELIKDLGKEKTIVVSTHLLDEAEVICNRVAIIADGKIKADGNLEDILTQTNQKNLEDAFRVLTFEEGANK